LKYNAIVERIVLMSYKIPENMNPRHRRLSQLIVAGNSQSQCARIFDVDKSTVCRWMKEPSVGMEIKRLQEMADVNVVTSVPGIPEKLQEGAHKGIEALIEILEDKRNDPEIMKLKSHVAVEILDRTGYGPIKQVDVKQESVSYQLTPEEIKEFNKRGIEAARESGIIIEVGDKA
jgi:hypothetical protein